MLENVRQIKDVPEELKTQLVLQMVEVMPPDILKSLALAVAEG